MDVAGCWPVLIDRYRTKRGEREVRIETIRRRSVDRERGMDAGWGGVPFPLVSVLYSERDQRAQASVVDR